MLRLTILGCAGSYPGPETACSGYLVEGGGVTVALDLGPGSLANLQRHVGLGELDAVVLSHHHPDHWIDLTGLLTATKYVLGREGLAVYGTAGTRLRLAALSDEFAPTFDWHDVAGGEVVAIGGLQVAFSATDHYVETVAVRISDGERALGYSADTGPGWSFRSFDGVPVDLALCESTVLDRDQREGFLHLSARQAGAMAREAGVGSLVLTHLLPGGDPEAYRSEAAEAFGGEVRVAAIHDRYEV